MSENPAFLKEQIITYLGNKRSLLGLIDEAISDIKADMKHDKISFADVFSGSGVVSRLAKKHAKMIFANDLESYSRIINECYLSNFTRELELGILEFHNTLSKINELKAGFITELYAPKDDENIKRAERVFFTRKNAMFIDTMRDEISKLPRDFQKFFIAPLIYEASVHNNTGGVFKGFYKGKNGIGKFGGEKANALGRIKGEIRLKMPVFSNFSCDFAVSQKDAADFAKDCERVDIAYFDPPYNEHPYGSNYFMLNLLASYQRPDTDLISKVSGIPKNWNRSAYNKKKKVSEVFFDLVNNVRARFVLISFNSEGFISKDEMIQLLEKIGKVDVLEAKYNTFRGSRNLSDRNIHVNEYLFLLEKNFTE